MRECLSCANHRYIIHLMLRCYAAELFSDTSLCQLTEQHRPHAVYSASLSLAVIIILSA